MRPGCWSWDFADGVVVFAAGAGLDLFDDVEFQGDLWTQNFSGLLFQFSLECGGLPPGQTVGIDYTLEFD